MALDDYAELVLEAARRTGVTDLTTRADMVVGMAEKYLSKRLRLAGQETETTLTTDSDGEATLPSDFEEIRSVRVSDRIFPRLDLDRVLTGSADGFTVRGSTLVSTKASADHVIVYYASIPSLDSNDTNHLLTAEPELYLYAVIFQAYSSAGDLEKAAVARGYVDTMIEEANLRSYLIRHGDQRLHLGAAP